MREDPRLRPVQEAPDSTANPAAPRAPKSRWERPRLVDHGDVRELTLGLTSGPTESGAPFARRL